MRAANPRTDPRPAGGEREGPTQREGEGQLALGELEAAAGFGFAVFLALDDAAVAGDEAAVLQDRPQAGLLENQRPADAVPHRPGLAGQPAALDRAPHVELAEPVGDDKGLVEQHA